MKTLNILTTAFIIALSFNAFADGKPNGKIDRSSEKTVTLISTPEMEWGNPEDVNAAGVEQLRNITDLLFDAPEMTWGNPEELDLNAIENLKNLPLLSAPEMVWGDPSDLYSFEISG